MNMDERSKQAMLQALQSRRGKAPMEMPMQQIGQQQMSSEELANKTGLAPEVEDKKEGFPDLMGGMQQDDIERMMLKKHPSLIERARIEAMQKTRKG